MLKQCSYMFLETSKISKESYFVGEKKNDKIIFERQHKGEILKSTFYGLYTMHFNLFKLSEPIVLLVAAFRRELHTPYTITCTKAGNSVKC